MAKTAVSHRSAGRADAGEARRPTSRPATFCTSRNGMGFAPSCSAAAETCSSRAATCGRSTAIFPSCTRSSSPPCPTAAWSTARSSSRRRAVSISTPFNCGFIRPRRASPSSRRKRRPRSWRSTLLAVGRARSARAWRRANGALQLERLLDGVKPPIHLTPMTRDVEQASEWLSRFEGAGLDGVIAKPAAEAVQAGQARDDQGEARAHRRLCRRRLSLAQEGERRARRLAAARAL